MSKPMTLTQEMELALLRELEKRVRAMFRFTGWEDDRDEDAAATVSPVVRVLDWIEDTRDILNPPTGEPSGQSSGSES